VWLPGRLFTRTDEVPDLAAIRAVAEVNLFAATGRRPSVAGPIILGVPQRTGYVQVHQRILSVATPRPAGPIFPGPRFSPLYLSTVFRIFV